MVVRQAAEMDPIRDGESYPLEVFKLRTGLSAWQLQEAKYAGLKVRHVGKQAYVLGSDWLAFLRRQGHQRSLSCRWLIVVGLLAKFFANWVATKK